MPRPERYAASLILDATRGVVADRGARGVTLAAIAHVSGAPVGSIYHRFGSLDELLAQVWLRAVRRSHAALAPALATGDPVQRAVRVALAVYDFCLAEREDACCWPSSAGAICARATFLQVCWLSSTASTSRSRVRSPNSGTLSSQVTIAHASTWR